MQLSQGDIDGIATFLDDLMHLDGDDPFPPVVLARLRQVVPCDLISYSELDRPHRGIRYYVDDPPFDGDDFGADLWGILARHPICTYHQRTGDYRASKLTDHRTRSELEGSRFHEEWMAPYSVMHEMNVGLDAPPTHTKVFLLDRSSGRDFSERDRAVLDLLRAPLALRYRTARLQTRIRSAMQMIDQTTDALLVADDEGRVLQSSPAASQMLLRLFGDDSVIPAAISEWLSRPGFTSAPLIMRLVDSSLTVRASRGVLLFDERHMHPKLTTREAEILDLVADGYTNADIAAALWISPGTVRRHLENVFAKLGVRTRTAAAAFAPQRR
jgi:DNA-binding NarL/FixJ family response regulator